jgi:hypothetical protein
MALGNVKIPEPNFHAYFTDIEMDTSRSQR